MKGKICNFTLRCLTTASFCVLIVLFWDRLLPGHLHYQESMQYFPMTLEYFFSSFLRPSGVASWTSEFLTQFFGNSFAGGFIIAVLLVLLQTMCWDVMRKFSRSGDITPGFYPLSFIPAVCALAFLCEGGNMLSAIIALLKVLGCFWLLSFSCRSTNILSLLNDIFWTILLYWCFGPFALIYALLSVAGYMMAKRGLILSAVHFYSYPYTSERARDKVVELAGLLSKYAGPIRLFLVPFTDIQMKIYDECPEKETTVIMRRLMMKIAERIAVSEESRALITGEALGQVASQTLESLCVTNDAVSMPVFRPLIGFDKDEIMELARKIGTYETSILPYEDCCTVFVPKHPVTKPDLETLRASEAAVDFSELIEKAIADTELMTVSKLG